MTTLIIILVIMVALLGAKFGISYYRGKKAAEPVEVQSSLSPPEVAQIAAQAGQRGAIKKIRGGAQVSEVRQLPDGNHALDIEVPLAGWITVTIQPLPQGSAASVHGSNFWMFADQLRYKRDKASTTYMKMSYGLGAAAYSRLPVPASPGKVKGTRNRVAKAITNGAV